MSVLFVCRSWDVLNVFVFVISVFIFLVISFCLLWGEDSLISWTKVSDKRSLHGPVPQRTLQLVLVYKRFGVIPIFVPTARLFVFLSTQFTAPTSPLFVHPPLENKLVLIALGLVVLCTKYSKLQGVMTLKRKNCRVFAEFRSPDHMISPSLCPLDTPTYSISWKGAEKSAAQILYNVHFVLADPFRIHKTGRALPDLF